MRPKILNIVKDHGFTIFESGSYNLNIIGVRNPSGETNRFDDMLIVVYKDDLGKWQEERFNCTTDPGLYWMKNGRSSGVAVLKHPQQMRGAYRIDKHKGRYWALCQRSPVTVWRDPNRDDIIDYDGDEDRGFFGINIHRAKEKGTSSNVWRWSAGCTVLADSDQFDRFMSLCFNQVDKTGYQTFTYTLLCCDLPS